MHFMDSASGRCDSSPLPGEGRQDLLHCTTRCKTIFQILSAIVLLAGLYALSRYSYLLFHTFIELFTAAVAAALFLLAWHSRKFTRDDAFVFLGCVNLCLAVIIILHTLAYKGMGVFVEWPGADLATQLWLISRTSESLSFLAFSFLIGRSLRPSVSLWGCLGVTSVLLGCVFLRGCFPTCYEEGVGLTRFKIVTEYLVCLALAGTMVILHRKRRLLDSHVHRLLTGSLASSILAGLAFTAYVNVYGHSNLLGHIFRLVSFFLLYQALIRSSLTRPYGTLFRELNGAREEVARRERYYRSILDHLHEDIRIIGPDGTVVEANRTYLESNGLSREQVIGLSCHCCAGPCEGMEGCGLGSAFATGKPVSRIHQHLRADGRTVHEDVLFSPLKDENGVVFQVIAAVRDVTELVETRKALEVRLMELDSIMESTEDGIMAMDERGRALHANTRFLDMWGLRADGPAVGEDRLKAKWASGFHPDPEVLMARLRDAHATVEEDCTVLQLKDGRTVEWYSRPLSIRDGKGGMIWVFRDVTFRRQMESQLSDSEHRLRTLVEEAPISIMTFDASGTVDFVNQYHLKVFSRNHGGKEAFLGRKITELPGLVRSGRTSELEPVLQGRPVVLDEVHVPKAGHGFSGYQRIKAVPIFRDSEVAGGILLREDITEQKRMAAVVEEQADHYRSIINATRDILYVIDTRGRILEVNDLACGIMGFDRSEFVGMSIPEIDATETSDEAVLRIQSVIERGSHRFESRHRTKAGKVLDVEVNVTFIPGSRHFVCFVHDISERKAVELALRQSLEEKIALLKEVHHRVKNNLQIVVSLLALQASRSRDPNVLDVLHDTRSRVHSMALLHEALYRSENLARTNFARYLEELCAQLLRSCAPVVGRVGIEAHVDPISLTLDQAVPCGLIVNELVSNALKHGYPDDRGGTITVEVHPVEEGQLRLRVSDDGVGLPSGGDDVKPRTLGLQLIGRLARQLGGRFTVDDGHAGGASFSVVFPLSEEARKEGY